ncbi:MAG: RNA helicase, partial [Frankia sp.]|nr:RNA helicase [Frankia sp.]
LAGVYSEADLLVTESLRRGVWSGLSAAELAACASAVVYEARGRSGEAASTPRIPGGGVRAALADMVRLWTELTELERTHRLDPMREPDVGFAWAAHQWASGGTFEEVLIGSDLTAGDFVRWVKQLIDLLSQVADVASDEPLAVTARAAIGALRRGVVAYSSVV